MTVRMQPNPCANMNHRRRDAPVGYCPQCGNVVNTNVARPCCSEQAHALARRQRMTFCVHCGTQLILPR